jgi:hypothetical protein
MSDDMQLEEVNLADSPSENTQSVPNEWQELDGKSQERFQKIARLKNEALEKAQRLEEENARLRSQSVIPAQRPSPGLEMTPEEQAADRRLQELDFTKKSEVEKMLDDKLQAIEGRAYLESQHAKLETKFTGEYPRYDRAEIEAEMKRLGNYNPESVYRDLYWDEIVQLEAKKMSEKQTKQPYSEKTRSRITSQMPWTPESLGERLRKPDGREFYQKNAEKITKLQTNWRLNGAS